jgi:hypothetical protein
MQVCSKDKNKQYFCPKTKEESTIVKELSAPRNELKI